jgi:hypothetical protein
MFSVIRTRRLIELEVASATHAATSRMVAAELVRAREQIRRERDRLEIARKQMMLMRREGLALAPESTDEVWGRYSIAEEEARQMTQVHTAPAAGPDEAVGDEMALEDEIRRELAELDGMIEAELRD